MLYKCPRCSKKVPTELWVLCSTVWFEVMDISGSGKQEL